MIKEKGNKLYVKWKHYDNSLNNFPKSYNPFGGYVKVELDVKRATDVDTSAFAKKFALINLKSYVYILDTDK